MNEIKICPHCGLDIEKLAKFCSSCGKPLITGLDNISVTNNLDFEIDKIAMDSTYEPLGFSPLFSIPEEKEKSFKNLNFEQNIAEIDKKLNEKQQFGEDTSDLLIEKASLFYLNRDLRSASKLFETALEIFKTEGNQEKLAMIYNDLGLIYEDLGYLDDSLNNYENSIELFKIIGENLNQVKVLNNIGNVYLTLENIELAFKVYSEAQKICKENGYLTEYLQITSNLIEIYFKIKNFPQAYKAITENMQLFRENDDIIGEIITNSKFGKLYYNLGKDYYKLAVGYIEASQKLIGTIKNKIGKYKEAQISWENYRLLGLINLIWNHNDPAKKYLTMSLNSIELFKFGPRVEEALILEDLAKFHYLNGDDNESLSYYQKVERIYGNLGNEVKQAEIKTKVSDILFKIFDNTNSAINYLESALDIYLKNNYLKESAIVYEKLAEIYEKIGSYDSAKFYLENALETYSNLNDEDKQNSLKEKINQLQS